ncbi:hypothetical protein GGI43DRAFT_393925 [Trichoderma evansii]
MYRCSCPIQYLTVAAVLLAAMSGPRLLVRWTARWGSPFMRCQPFAIPPSRLTSANSRPREIGRLGACSTPGSPLT